MRSRDHAHAAERAAAHVMDTYGTPAQSFVSGQGAALVDHDGEPWLDLLCGLAVTNLGHSHPAVAAAVEAQVRTLVHTSNLYLTDPALDLAERLAAITGWEDAKVFFAQCGATANEAALKLARRHGKAQHPDKVRVVTLEGSFHGRSFATLEATGQPAKHTPFEPLLGFVDTVPFDDPDALRAAVTDEHCAVLLEPVQGEGGVRPVPDEVLVAAREACDEHGALLLFDEVQTGIGRTGSWFAFQQGPVEPDVVTSAKALANGLPIGACIAHGEAALVFQPGDHATTFGGNPVTTAAAVAVLDTIEREDLLARARELSAALVAGIEALAEREELVQGVRGLGLLLGIELTAPVAADVARACAERHLLVNAVGAATVRIAPPLVLTDEEVALALAGIEEAVAAVAASATATTASPPPPPAEGHRPMVTHFLRSSDLSPGEQATVLEHAATLKRDRDAALAAGRDPRTADLHGRTVAIVFEKPSLRTRVSFEVGIHELGGHPMKIDDAEIGLGKRETIADTAAVLSRYVQGIVLRTFGQERIDELAAHATVPVVNALTDLEHPCQALADLQTMHQAFGDVRGRTLTYVGDGNNVAHSLLVACAQAGVGVRVAHPAGYAPDEAVVATAREAAAAAGTEVTVTTDVRAACTDTDALYTDVWASMGQEDEAEERLARFAGFQVTSELLGLASDDAIVLHCLPAHRGEEIAADVLDGPASRVFDQAENRLHAQKALLLHLLT